MFRFLKEKISKRDWHLKPIFLFASVLFFWTIYDTILTYITPLLMEERGFSVSMIGFIIGTSSISGAIFDFFICKLFKNSDFRRMFLVMFAICLFYPLLLSQAETIWLFLFAVAVWGIYYDLYAFGAFNFVGRYTKEDEHAANFGIIQFFRALADVIGPFIAGLVIVSGVYWHVFAVSWFFLVIGIGLFIILILIIKKYPSKKEAEQCVRKRNFLMEIHLWKKLATLMTPVLFVTFFIYFVESFFWTLAPLFAESAHFGRFGGLFLTAYLVPALFVGWIVGDITKRFGKKRTAIVGILVSSIILVSFFYITNPILLITSVFISSCFISISLPAINGAYADYISEAPQVDSEIEGIEDFLFNISYVIGPIAAGVIADLADIPTAFTFLGLLGIALAMVLLIVTPKSINISISPKELQ